MKLESFKDILNRYGGLVEPTDLFFKVRARDPKMTLEEFERMCILFARAADRESSDGPFTWAV